jgi:NADPH-dependent ferric siderophore reductase
MSESTTSPAGRARRARPQAVLTVLHRERIAPHTVRITAGGPGFGALRVNGFTDKYAKIIFADPGLGLTPPYDLAALRDSLPPGRQPVTRTYTLRRADARRQQVDIDFVVHGDKGIAAPWAARAEPGDLLTLSGVGGAYRPDPGSDWHLLAGDESALPAICAATEALPVGARGIAYLETSDPGEYLDATPSSGVQVTWLHRPGPGSEPPAGRRAAGRALGRRPGRRVRPRRAGVDEGGPRRSQGPARRRRPGFPVRLLGGRPDRGRVPVRETPAHRAGLTPTAMPRTRGAAPAGPSSRCLPIHSASVLTREVAADR